MTVPYDPNDSGQKGGADFGYSPPPEYPTGTWSLPVDQQAGGGGSFFPDPSAPGNLPPGTDFYGSDSLYDPYNVYLSTIPIMEMTRDEQLADAMTGAGFSGNRYSSGAQNIAAQIGGQTTLGMQAMLNQLLYNQTNADLDRALQAATQGGLLGTSMDQMALNRLGALSDFGTYEQNRWDDIMRLLFQDFRANQYGLLPYMIGASGGVTAPYPYSTVQAGEPGVIQQGGDLASLALKIAEIVSAFKGM